MEMEQNSDCQECTETTKINEIINHLVNCTDVFFKSQQRGEDELELKEKKEIALQIFSNTKSGFLARFGKHLQEEHLEYFKQFSSDDKEGYAVGYYITDLKRYFTAAKRAKDIRNRRYDALKKLSKENNYFSETEMMRRNPLLYDQLVGQYLSEDERKKRDNIDTKNITFVNLLLESIDRDWTKKKQKQQQDNEDETMEEVDSSDEETEANKNNSFDSWDEEISPTYKWGEFESETRDENTFRSLSTPYFENQPKKEIVMITADERKLLKEEFISIMYQNFLDGKDTEFDYSLVDNNDEYDNLDIKTHDAEDSYFDSESPEDISPENVKMVTSNDASEDELDVFMNRLNEHHSIQNLSEKINKL